MTILAILMALVFPPVAVFIKAGFGAPFWLNVILTLFGYFPGVIHALYVVLAPPRVTPAAF